MSSGFFIWKYWKKELSQLHCTGMNEPKFTVVIVSWNVKQALLRCVGSLMQASQGTAEVVVVDNASNDGTAVALAHEYMQIRVLPQSANLGFAKACNLGASLTTAPGLVFLNPDTEVSPGFFSELEKFLAQHTQVGVVGAQISNPDGTTQASVRGLPTLWPLALDSLKVLKRLPWLAPAYLLPRFDYSESKTVDQVMGACFIVPRNIWERLNGFNEDYFVWFEEVDFCARVKKLGLDVWYDANLKLMHQQGQSANQLSYIRRHLMYTRSMSTYAKLHLGKCRALLLRLTSILGLVIMMLVQAFASLIRKNKNGNAN